MNRLVLLSTLAFILNACSPDSPAPQSHVVKKKASATKDKGTGDSKAEKPDDDEGEAEAQPIAADPKPDESDEPVLMPPETMDPVVEQPPVAPEPMVPETKLVHPEGCSGMAELGTKDILLFDGEKETANNNVIPILQNWKVNDVWGSGRVAIEENRKSSAIVFTSQTFYHGFKLSPPDRKEFRMSSIEVYVDTNRSDSQAAFGLRIIKKGEDEGNGAAPTTSWFRKAEDGSGAENKADTVKFGSECKLVKMYTPKTFIDAGKASDRIIWEMMPSWENANKLRVYKIVLRGFEWKS